MATTHSDDHLGTLTVESRPDLQTEIIGVTWGEARAAMEQLATSQSPIIVNRFGHCWVLSGLSYTAAAWAPETAPVGDET